jgi:hypothetical protein
MVESGSSKILLRPQGLRILTYFGGKVNRYIYMKNRKRERER